MSGRRRKNPFHKAPPKNEEGKVDESTLRPWAECATSAMKENTLKPYLSSLDWHTACGYSVDFSGLVAHLRGDPDETGLTRGTASVLVNAVRFGMRCQDPPCFLNNDQQETVKMLVGSIPIGGNGRTRGAINDTMLQQLMDYVYDRRHGAPQHRIDDLECSAVRWHLALVWMTGLRRCQAETLRKRDFVWVDGKLFIHVPKIHDPKENTRVTSTMLDIPITIPQNTKFDWYARLIKSLQELPNDDSLLMPLWHKYDLNKYIQNAAKKFGWNTDELKFDGIHCLRHGVIQTVREAQGIIAAAIKAGHVLPTVKASVTEHYAKPNALRGHVTAEQQEEINRQRDLTSAALHEQAAARRTVRQNAKIAKKNAKKVPPKKTNNKTKPSPAMKRKPKMVQKSSPPVSRVAMVRTKRK